MQQTELRQVPNPLWLIAGDCIMVIGWSLAWLAICIARHFNLAEDFGGWFVGAALSALTSRMLLHVSLSHAQATVHGGRGSW